jgi:hypothetical protein
MESKPKNNESYGATTRRHLQNIDKVSPGKHFVRIYNALNRTAAATLVQLRTNISRLNTYLRKIIIADTDRCERGIVDVVPHFLFACPRWKIERQAMRAAHGSRYWDLSYARGVLNIRKRWGKG